MGRNRSRGLDDPSVADYRATSPRFARGGNSCEAEAWGS